MVFPTLKAKQALALLQREPLAYRIEREKGSHKKLVSGRPGARPIGFSYHAKATVPSGVLRTWLMDYAGLSEDEAKKVL